MNPFVHGLLHVQWTDLD